MSGVYGIIGNLERVFERSTCFINFFGVTRRLTFPERDGQA
jgi:hypothetical protein